MSDIQKSILYVQWLLIKVSVKNIMTSTCHTEHSLLPNSGCDFFLIGYVQQ